MVMLELINYFDQHSMVIVLMIVLVIWFGICWYLFRLGKRVRRLEDTGKVQ
jgi:CcmD family protein